MVENNNHKKITDFLYEVGTLRKIVRAHRQHLPQDDSDTIASHSYRVAIIGWFLAKAEKVDPYRVVMMCLMHDVDEARSGDHNWVHKKYVKVFSEEIIRDQLGTLPDQELFTLMSEYERRESKESLVAKDADCLDQILLLREYAWAGSHEAHQWLYGKGKGDNEQINKQLQLLKTKTAQELGKQFYDIGPSEWWEHIWTNERR